MTKYDVIITDSLEKVLPSQPPRPMAGSVLRAWPGETVSFQVAARVVDGVMYQIKKPALYFEGPGAQTLRVRRVRLMPVLMATQCESDDAYITHTPAMLPDALIPLPQDQAPVFQALNRQWDAFWCDWQVPADSQAGEIPLTVIVRTEDAEVFRRELVLQIQKDALPEQKLLHTEWFHTDCLADYYHVEPWSEEHWKIVSNFMASAASYGINMLLTPLFTPSLDTEIGKARTTCQLLGVEVKEGRYQFDFSLLDKWIDLCHSHGIQEIEICHLFTQWGAEAAPNVMATVDGQYQRIFGWHTPAVGGEYTRFLRCLLPELKAHLRQLGVLEHTWFHISDEPVDATLDAWKAARNTVIDLLEDCHMIDALSSVRFYKEGLIQTPVPANSHIEPFVAENIPNLWTYYCCSQAQKVSNRFVAMPSGRTRIIGTQLYRYDLKGFLHWGFNFYNAERSLSRIDPWQTLDGYGSWPAGDPFLVYPGADGMPVESIRGMMIREAFQDARLLQLAEDKLGREAVLQLLRDSWNGKDMTMEDYPYDAAWFAAVRDKLAEVL